MQAVLKSRLPATRHGMVAAAFIAVLLTLGGGGTPSALSEILVQLAFAAAVLAWTVWASARHALPPLQPAAVAIATLPLALVVIQLVPLPPFVWTAVPGRAILERALSLVDGAPPWHALSLAPRNTLASLLAMIPVAGLMVGVTMLGRRDRRALLLTVVIVGVAAAALGAAQMAGPGEAFRLYELSHRGWVTGFFANRNSAADLFLIASLALAAWSASRPGPRPREKAATLALAMVQAMFLVALILTGSRTGIALLAVAAVFHLLIYRSTGARIRWRRVAAGAGAIIAGLAALPLVIAHVPRFASVAQRFDTERDFRAELWQDTAFAITQYFPFGSGTGTFVTAYLPIERLEIVDTTYPNRAHNDFLELVLETGVFGPVVLAVMIGLTVQLFRRGRADGGLPASFQLFSLGTLTIIALHSIVDYPLRTMALAGMGALAVGLAAPRRAASRGEQDLGLER